jgi:hydroxyacylglutathione hydrolase
MLTVTPVPAFADNYLWLIRGEADPARAAVVDPGDANAVLAALSAAGLSLDTILVTHHHPDHIGGVAELVGTTGAQVYGPAREQVPANCRPVRGGDTVMLPTLGLRFDVLDVPGHTAGHVAYYGHGAVFCGDTLFSGGCGRLFEGTPEQMLASLDALAGLPDDTRAYCAHEYTLSNLRFAMTVDPDNGDLRTWQDEAAKLRERGLPTVPTTIGREKLINPFLRSRAASVRRSAEAHAGAALATPVAVFAEIRRWKDGFR